MTKKKIRKLAEQWEMLFDRDPTEQVQEVFFSGKSHSSKHPNLYFNNPVVENRKPKNI